MAKKTLLSNTAVKYLRSVHRKQKDPKAGLRPPACIYKRQGMGTAKIAENLNTPHTAVTGRPFKIERDGIRRRHDTKHGGPACNLDEKQLERLRQNLDAGPGAFGPGISMRSAPPIARHVKKGSGADYGPHSVRELIRRLGFSCRTPRQANPKAASRGRRNEHKKKASEEAGRYGKNEHEAFAADGMH